MNTAFLLMAQYSGAAIIPVDRVCHDYFSHLSVQQFVRKCSAGELKLPLVRIDGNVYRLKNGRGLYLKGVPHFECGETDPRGGRQHRLER